jgi:hypothetical protein
VPRESVCPTLRFSARFCLETIALNTQKVTKEINTTSNSIPIASESQSKAFKETPGKYRINQIGHPKTHNENVTEASSLNKALTNSTVMNMAAVTSTPVATDAKRSFMDHMVSETQGLNES